MPPGCSQTCLHIGIPWETSKMTAACALSPEMVTKLFWDVAWALEVLKDPQDFKCRQVWDPLI